MALAKSIRWQSTEHQGLEQLRIDEWPEGIKVRSAIVGQAGDDQHGVFYEVNLTPDWRFQAILLQRTDGRVVVLRRGDDGVWLDIDGKALPELEG